MTNYNERAIIFVGNLTENIDENELQQIFETFGEIKNIEIPVDPLTKVKKGFGFIEFDEYDDCLHAIENMEDSELNGRILRVSFARENKFKEGHHRPVWMEEEYHRKYLNSEEQEEKADPTETQNI